MAPQNNTTGSPLYASQYQSLSSAGGTSSRNGESSAAASLAALQARSRTGSNAAGRPSNLTSSSLARTESMPTARERPSRPSRRRTSIEPGTRPDLHPLSPARPNGSSMLSPTGNASSGGSQLEQLEAKVVILGSQGVGKTSIVHRYTTGQFSNTLSSTIGASFMTKRIVMPDCKVRLQIWDTAGQERFRSMAPIYYRGSQAAILVYDITNPSSFEDIKVWLKELRQNMNSELVVHVVGSKADLRLERKVHLDEARQSVEAWVREPASDSESDGGATSPLSSPATSPMQQSPGPTSPPLGKSTGSRMGLVSQLSFAAGRKSQDELRLPADPPQPEPWCQVDISEVSAKDDYGIEDVFFHLTSRLVQRKTAIEREQHLRARHSVMLDAHDQDEAAPASWSCCA